MDVSSEEDRMHEDTGLDTFVFAGLRLWMILGFVFAIFLVLTIVICCIMKIRIPRTKREIEIISAQRKLRRMYRNRNQLPVIDINGGNEVDDVDSSSPNVLMTSLYLNENHSVDFQEQSADNKSQNTTL